MQALTDKPSLEVHVPVDQRSRQSHENEAERSHARVCTVCDEAAAQLGSETQNRKSQSEVRNAGESDEQEDANASLEASGKQSIERQLERKLTLNSQRWATFHKHSQHRNHGRYLDEARFSSVTDLTHALLAFQSGPNAPFLFLPAKESVLKCCHTSRNELSFGLPHTSADLDLIESGLQLASSKYEATSIVCTCTHSLP